ncbi:MAG: lytic transglycosylase domain-containing protein [Terriglobales bacterium]
MRNRVLAVLTIAIWLATSTALAAQTADTTPKTSSKKSTKTSAKTKRKARRKKTVSPQRIRRIRRAFVASSELKPMARQLLENRSAAAYAGVEAYARRHAHDDAGVLANLALGYAHTLDHDPAKAIEPLKLAQARAGDLADYTTYLLGSSYQATGQTELAVATLRDFNTRYSDSIFSRDAAVAYANALVASGSPAQAAALLDKYRRPYRSDLEYVYGRALLRAGDTARGTDVLRHIYFSTPLAAEAEDAGKLLSASGEIGANYALQKARADQFAQAKRYREAAQEYRSLLPLATPEDRPAVEVALAGALHHSGDDRQARQMLESMSLTSSELNGERLFYLGEMARGSNDDDRFLSILAQLRQTTPTSSYLEQALLSAGNMFLLRNDYDRAIDCYREIVERFPQGKLAPYAHWKVAWLNLREGRADAARKGFEEQIALYPGSQQVPAAVYWRARLAEEEQNSPKARVYYQKLSQRFRNYYYAELARERLQELKHSSATDSDPVLEKIPPIQLTSAYTRVQPPADDLRAQKAELLQNGGLTEFAIRELRMAAEEEDGASWATAEIARLYRDNGQYYRALQVLKRAVPSYFAMDLEALPRPYWEDLFPRPWWTDVKKYSSNNGLDPFLVASLIRQESEFNPEAISHANAWGLMQVLPSTGKKLAHSMKVHYSNEQLLTPNYNLQLGTRYFRELVDHFNGKVEYALAAYNAGTDRVDSWLSNGKYRDAQEFVESIPFTETREYVQSVLRNATVYKRLYGTP